MMKAAGCRGVMYLYERREVRKGCVLIRRIKRCLQVPESREAVNRKGNETLCFQLVESGRCIKKHALVVKESTLLTI